jgi:hypothetical protein
MDKEVKYQNTGRIEFNLKEVLYAKKLEDNTQKELEQLNFIDNFHVCNICKLVVHSAKNLRRHMKKHEQTTIKFRCDWCQKLLARRDSLKRHSKNIHFLREEKFHIVKILNSMTPSKDPPKKMTILKKPTFRIIQGKTGQLDLKKKKIHKQPKTEDLKFNIPRPISPLSPTPKTEEHLQTDRTTSPTNSSSTSTICEDEHLMHNSEMN